MNNVRVYSY